MRCDEGRALLDLFLDGELPEEITTRIDRHLLRCSECAGAIRSLEQTRALLREAVEPAEPSPAFRERTLARLHDRLSHHLRPVERGEVGRQWELPFRMAED